MIRAQINMCMCVCVLNESYDICKGTGNTVLEPHVTSLTKTNTQQDPHSVHSRTSTQSLANVV